ncbi:MAG: dockerin type I domain-containing protein, partial [Verrucomicrobiota bacterium]|nr:dockerin type I domain-containing protein [Verrucomicrobiota bacterium]
SGTGFYTYANFDPTATTPAANFRAYTSTLGNTSNDNASKVVDPQFVSNTDLHISPTSPLVDMGANVGVLKDIDGRNRVGIPDIGAHEPGGTTPLADDIAAVAIVSPSNGAVRPQGTSFVVQASFKNLGTAAETNVPVRFTITDSMNNVIYNQTATIASIAPDQTVTVTFPNATIATAGTYTTQATSELPNDQNPANNSVTGSFTVAAPLTGTITVGTGGTYPSLTNSGGAFDAINGVGVSGNLTINVISDVTTETGAIALNEPTESGAGGYSITIKPSGGARIISGTSTGSSGLIKLNGADRVTIDGSLSGGSDQSLTIMSGNAGGTVIWIASGPVNGANNDTVKNCIISGTTGVSVISGILSGSGVTLGNDAEFPNNNITVQNNKIFRVQNSCYLRGNATTLDTGWLVSGNTFGSTVATDKNTFRGMLIGNCAGFFVSANTVNGIVSTAASTAKITGIQTALAIEGGTIAKNRIRDIKQTNPSTYGAAGIDLTGGNNIAVRNNFVSDVNHNMSGGLSFSTTFGVFGIQIEAGTGHQVYGNSVNLYGVQPGTASSALLTAAFAINATTSTGCDVRDNIFANNITGGTTSIAHVAVYLPSGGTSAMNLTLNYNAYFWGTDTARQGVGQAGTTAGTNFFTTLAAFRSYTMGLSPASNNDSNSLGFTTAPPFVSLDDLHVICGAPVIRAGVPIAALVDDIDGDPRDAAAPTMGADEPVAPSLTNAVSRKTHNMAGDFDIPLPGVESRSGGPNGDYTIVLTFGLPVTFDGATVSNGTGMVTSTSGSGTNSVVINLTGVMSQQYVTVTLLCANNGTNSGNVSVTMGVLVGDATGDGFVNAADSAYTRNRSGQPVDATNFRADYNLDGNVNAADSAIVRSRSGDSLPTP